MEARDYYRFLIANQDLFRAVLDFNNLGRPPAALRSPGRPEGPAAEPFMKSLLASPSLWRYFPADERPPAFWDFRAEPRRLALLDDSTFTRLTLVWGVAVWAPLLARLIRRPDVTWVKEELSLPLYTYALHRARFQLGSLRAVFLDEQRPAEQLTREILEHCGFKAVSLCLDEAPEPFKIRLGWRWRPESGPKPSPEILRLIWFWLKKILLTEVAPQWQPCFT